MLFAAALVYGVGVVSPPSLMDDVDAVQAQIARNMLASGDWVTARLNGVAYLEKAPMPYWMMAASFAIFGVHDWAARIPFALSAIALCWLTFRIGARHVSPRAGLYAGLALATAPGLWLFTRIQIPDVTLTLSITAAMWAFLARRPAVFWASLGIGFLLKGLIAILFPAAAAALFLTTAHEWRTWREWKPFSGALLTLAVALPWVILAAWRNPPFFDFTMRSAPGEYHGFFWFFFLNEHLFRFLNMRHPRDYNTVPRAAFWLFHLLWLFPWTAFLPAAIRFRAPSGSPAARLRLLCLCWAGFILVFFTFSTTQEYYSMPCYPALALLLGMAMDRHEPRARSLAAVFAVLALGLLAILGVVRDLPAPGDISRALTLNPEVYTLSLGHMKDLTLPAFAYLRLPLGVACAALALGAFSAWRYRGVRLAGSLAAAMVIFYQAARLALVAFDPYLSSRPLAEALRGAPPGVVVFDNQYYTFSSVFFYADARGLLLNGRVNNLEYGSYAPGAPAVFIDDARFEVLWRSSARHYLLIEGPSVSRIAARVGRDSLHLVRSAGGKFLFSNQPL